MVPEKGAHKEELDERLIEARDEVLLEGESVVAAEPGDQGQAVVLTDSRIIILKAGITATGMLNGRRTGAYPLGKITSVSLRKGPMGAVLQISGEAVVSSPEERPESIVVFSGPDKVKHCEAIAVKIEAAMGKPIDRIEPQSEAGTEANPEPAPSPEPVAETKPKARRRTAKSTPAAEVTEVAEAAEVGEVVDNGDLAPEPEKPKEQKPRGGRVAKSLAEEMFGDSAPVETPPARPVAESQPIPPPAPEPVAAPAPEIIIEMPKVAPPPVVIEPAPEVKLEIAEPEPEVVAEEIPAPAPEPEPEVEQEPEQKLAPGFRPNPNLPKPMRKRGRGPSKALVMMGGLMLLVFMGLAITAPLRDPHVTPDVEVNIKQLTNSASVIRRHYIAVSSYRAEALAQVKESDRSTAAVRSAIASRNHQAIIAAFNNDASDTAWTKVSEMKVPMGLAGARESLVGGLFIRKSAIEGALTGSVSSAETLRKLAEADQHIAKGTAVIDQMLKDLQSRMPSRVGKHK